MKKSLALIMALLMVLGLFAGCGKTATEAKTEPAAATEAPVEEKPAEETPAEEAPAEEKAAEEAPAEVKAVEDMNVVVITMDSVDQHWVTLYEGAQQAAAELGCKVEFKSPNVKDDAQQIECINNAVAAGADAICVAANGADSVTSALKEAEAAGVKIIYVDSPANFKAEATFSTDNKAAGKTAGEEMIKALEAKGVTEGSIGIVNVNAATDSTVQREAGFREAFEGKAYTLLETQYGEGDAAKSQTIAENYITQGVVGIFGANEGSTTGTGNAIKAAGADVVGIGFDKSDAIKGLILDGYLLATMAQNPDVMGADGVKAAVAAIQGEDLGGAVTDTGVSVLTAEALGGAASAAEEAVEEAPAEEAAAEETAAVEGKAAEDCFVAVITMDSVDQHWIALKGGAEKAGEEFGCKVEFMSPMQKDDAQQIECINNAVAAGADAICVAANGADSVTSALKEATEAGVKIVYVDSPANFDAEATFSTDNKAAGKTAGEEMLKALEAKGITEGDIGIVNVNAATDSTVQREAGFREAFEGSAFNLLETQYGEGDAAKSQTIAENYITQGVVGIFGANEGSTTGTGNAIKAAGADVVGVGFDKSDAIQGLILDGYLLATMAQNPDVMGYEGVKAALAALAGEDLGGAVTDTGVSVLTAEALGGAAPAAEEAVEEAPAEEAVVEGKAAEDCFVAVITMDSVDQHWIALKGGAEKAGEEFGCKVEFMSPMQKDDAQQIECINNAVAAGADAICVAANGRDSVTSALKEAAEAGVKIVYVDSPANFDAEATFSTDNKAAGKTAGEEMLKALEAKGITEGDIGIVNVNAATDSTVQREAGFREAFEGSAFNLLETQYGEGDAAKSQTIAENYITQGVVGIFGANEGSTTGTGNAIKAAGADVVGVGFDKSDAIQGLILDGYLLATMAQNPDVMGYEGVKAALAALAGEDLGGAVTDTGVSVLTAEALKEAE